jgi:hypothetical protein
MRAIASLNEGAYITYNSHFPTELVFNVPFFNRGWRLIFDDRKEIFNTHCIQLAVRVTRNVLKGDLSYARYLQDAKVRMETNGESG